MGIFEGITHSEEIEDLINSVQSMYDAATESLEEHKKSTSKSLEKLGKLKLQAWSDDMSTFLANFGAFANVQMKCIDDGTFDFLEKDLTPNQLMVNMKTASVNANEVIKAGALSIGTGALVGIASYGGVMMFAKASTGTAIATLSGAAKTNATLAWFGGGSIKAGGMGMLAGKVVLAGVVLAPIAIVAGTIAAAKGKERLAEAQKVHAEAKKAVAQIETVITGLEGIEKISESYIELLNGLSNQFKPFLKEMESIAKDYTPEADGKIDFNKLSEMEQKTLHLSWLLAQLYYHSLSKPILTEDGKVDPKANQMLDYSQKEYRQLSLDVTNLENEKQKIKQTLDEARDGFDEAVKKLENQRKKSRKFMVKQGKKRLQFWNETISPFVETISGFENIDVNNLLVSADFDSSIDEAFDRIFMINDASKIISKNRTYNTDDASAMQIVISGIGVLGAGQEAGVGGDVLISTQMSDTVMWLQNGYVADKEWMLAEVLPTISIRNAQGLLDNITGKENLSSAEYINSEIKNVVQLVNEMITKIIRSQTQICKQEKVLKRISRLLTLYETELTILHKNHEKKDGLLDFECLHEEEKKIVQMACNLAKLYYCVADVSAYNESSELLTGILIEDGIKNAKKELHFLRKSTFKMQGTDLRVANILWAPEARNVSYINYAFMVLFAIVGILQIVYGNWLGLIGIAGIVIALPKFFYYKDLRESQLWFWRFIRLLIACFIVIAVEIVGMVV